MGGCSLDSRPPHTSPSAFCPEENQETLKQQQGLCNTCKFLSCTFVLLFTESVGTTGSIQAKQCWEQENLFPITSCGATSGCFSNTGIWHFWKLSKPEKRNSSPLFPRKHGDITIIVKHLLKLRIYVLPYEWKTTPVVNRPISDA